MMAAIGTEPGRRGGSDEDDRLDSHTAEFRQHCPRAGKRGCGSPRLLASSRPERLRYDLRQWSRAMSRRPISDSTVREGPEPASLAAARAGREPKVAQRTAAA